MNTLLIFIWIIAAFICMAFWEAYVEGKHPWAKKALGWRKRITKRYVLTAYHFWVNLMFAFLISLPLVVYGWNSELAGVLISAGVIGLIVEDFLWFIVNPFWNLKKFNSKAVYWYHWIKIGKFEIPWGYVIGIAIAVLSGIFLWF